MSQIHYPFRFNYFFKPGLYAIVNNRTNKHYVGEAENLADRLASHFKKLNSARNHDCAALQRDWDAQGGQDFSFEILEIGPQWSERIVRLQKEREIVLSLSTERVYNLIK